MPGRVKMTEAVEAALTDTVYTHCDIYKVIHFSEAFLNEENNES